MSGINKNCGIYIIKNTINSKVYIGSSKNIKSRLYDHKSLLKRDSHSSTHLQNSYNKYGLESFTFERLEWCEQEQLFERERWWILLFNSIERKYGYNLSLPEGNGGYSHSQETKDKISKSRKEYIKENPNSLNHLNQVRGTNIRVVNFKTKQWWDYNSIKEAGLAHNMTDTWIKRNQRKYVDKLPYNDLGFITLNSNAKQICQEIYRKYQQGEGYKSKSQKIRPVYTMNIYTQETRKHNSFTKASKYLSKDKCFSKTFINTDRYYNNHVLAYTTQECVNKINRLSYRIDKGNKTKKSYSISTIAHTH
jgi:group I intron endonuclease